MNTPYSSDVSIFSVDAILSHSFATFFKHPFVFVGLSFLAQLPGEAISFWTEGNGITQAADLIFGLTLQGATTYCVYEALQDNAVRFGKSLVCGLRRVISIVGAVILFTLSAALPLAVTIAAAAAMGGSRLMGLIGIACFAISLPVIWCVWCVMIPACVVEGLGPIASLKRSAELTRGCRWKIAGIYLLTATAIGTVSRVSGYVTESVLMPAANIAGPLTAIIAVALADMLVNAATLAFSHITTAVVYYGLREVQDGITVDKLADVFN